MPRASRSKLAARALTAVAALAAATGAEGAAWATEGQTDVGGAALLTVVNARGKGGHLGGGGVVFVRHGLTDAFDLAGELSLAVQPSMGSYLLGAAAGAQYVVDIARFRPHFGLLLGATDLWTTACDPRPSNLATVEEDRPPLFACGHELLPAATVPLGLEWAPEAPFRVGFASRVTVLPFRSEVPDTLLVVGLGASFTWIFADAAPVP